MEKLDSRLSAAAEFVNEGTVAADIGTDHGYLVCSLIERGICSAAYATDINIKPLESARALIKELGYEDKIETRLADGLEGLPEKGIQEVLVCGMGGETIISILERCKWVKSELVHLVLQPMTRADMLRRWLCENGWRIDAEKAVEAEGHLYSVMSVYYCGDKFSPDDIYCLVGEIAQEESEAAAKYIRWQSSIQRNIAAGLIRSEKEKENAMKRAAIADMLEEQAEELERYV